MNPDSADNSNDPNAKDTSAPAQAAVSAGNSLTNSPPDPWEDAETAHLRAFLKLTHAERFHLLMDALEFMHKLRPPT